MMEKITGRFRRKICERLRGNRGVSFAELLITLLILSLSSAGMAGGVLFAKGQIAAIPDRWSVHAGEIIFQNAQKTLAKREKVCYSLA